MPPAPSFIAYTGRSMYPTLIEPELLEVVPYSSTPVHVGDVVFFVQAADAAQIVHRVVRLAPAGLVTRGDNSPGDDEGLCRFDDVRGQVVAAWRGQRRRAILGGRLGQWGAWSLRMRRMFLAAGGRLLTRPYHALARCGLLRPLVPAGLRPRVLSFQNEGLVRYRLVMGRLIVGEYDAARRAWRIQPPFLVFTDVAALPPKQP